MESWKRGALIRRLEGTPFESLTPDGTSTQWASVRLLSPVPAPRIFGLGLNYADHAAEGGKEHPPQPMLFMKPSTAAIGRRNPSSIPPKNGIWSFTSKAELVAVIGTKTRRVSVSEALDHVLGYTCGNDVSERVIQKAEMKEGCLLMGKGYDTFCPLGPAIATGLDPTDLLLLARVNGRERQRTSTSDLIYPVAEIVSYMSQAMTLLPGDVILTDALGRGTHPSGRPGGDRDPPGGRPLQSGGVRRERQIMRNPSGLRESHSFLAAAAAACGPGSGKFDSRIGEAVGGYGPDLDRYRCRARWTDAGRGGEGHWTGAWQKGGARPARSGSRSGPGWTCSGTRPSKSWWTGPRNPTPAATGSPMTGTGGP